ncbi:MAG: hypothetical protein GWP07_00665 [Xanthomonadaceae bacterium]|nr:hypothetical protein [Xanthomonadaceae bacterium]
MLRAVDMQQILLQTTTVSKMQQQGAHGAEIEQSKLAQQQLLKEEKQQRDIQEINQSEHPVLDNNPHKREDQSSRHPPREGEAARVKSNNSLSETNQDHRRTGGVFIDVKA